MDRAIDKIEKFSPHLNKLMNFAIHSREIILWYRNDEAFDSKKYFWVNDVMVDKLGLTKNEEGLVLSMDYYATIVQDEEGKAFIENLYEVRDLVKSDPTIKKGTYMIKARNLMTSEIFYLEFILEIFERYPNGDIKAWGGNGIDVTEDYLRKMEVESLANYDKMTGLYNRNYVDRYVVTKLPESYGLIVFDLDNLKLINDVFGHLEGDHAIKTVAKLISNSYSNDSIIARTGGDEFIVISQSNDEHDLLERANHIIELLEVDNENHLIDFSVSYGIKIVRNQDLSFDDAFTLADNIMYGRKLAYSTKKKGKSLDTVFDMLVARTDETKMHSQRIADNAVKLLNKIGMPTDNELYELRTIAMYHDIGKVTLPDSISSNQGKLTKNDFKIVMKHSEVGYKILNGVISNKNISLGVLFHHERWDGTGYPFGIKEIEIPLYSRIIAICDSYDVMMNGRPYYAKKSKDEILAELKRCRGEQFDPVLLDAFLELIDEGNID